MPYKPACEPAVGRSSPYLASDHSLVLARYTTPCLSICPQVAWYKNMTSSIKLDVRHCQRRTKPRPQATSTKNLVKFICTVFELCVWTDAQQKERQTYSSQYFQGEVNILLRSNEPRMQSCINDRLSEIVCML